MIGKRLLVAVVMWCGACAWAQASEELPAGARSAFERGTVAAQQGEWTLAIKYFSETLKEVPDYYPAYFNLALAHSRAGHETAAIAWFRAYLQHVPDAAEKKEILRQITALEVAVEAKIDKLFKQSIELADALPTSDGQYGNPRDYAYSSIFNYHAFAGRTDEAAAIAAAQKPNDTYYTRERAIASYAETIAGEGDTDKALEIAATLPASYQTGIYGKVADNLLYKDRIDEVLPYLGRMPKPQDWYGLQTLIAKLAELGRAAEARALLDRYEDKEKRFTQAMELAKVLGAQGDRAGALDLIRTEGMPFYAAFKQDSQLSADRLIDKAKSIWEAYLAAGEPAQAKALADTFDLGALESWMNWPRLYLGETYAKAGDMAKAVQCLSGIGDTEVRDRLGEYIFNALAARGDYEQAARYLHYVKYSPFNPYAQPTAYGKIAWAKLKAGDRKGFEGLSASLPSVPGSTGAVAARDQFNVEISVGAYKDGQTELADEYFRKIQDPYWQAQAARASAYSRFEKGELDEARDFLKRQDPAIWRPELGTFYLVSELSLKIAQAYLGVSRGDKAAEVLDWLAPQAEQQASPQVLEKIAELYDRVGSAGQSEASRRSAETARAKAADLSWVSLALQFEQSHTYDAEAYLRKAQAESADKIPDKLAALAWYYATDLRKIAAFDAKVRSER